MFSTCVSFGFRIFVFIIRSVKSAIFYVSWNNRSRDAKGNNKFFTLLLWSKEVKVLYLFSDNCVAQNKNHTMIQYLFTPVETERFQKDHLQVACAGLFIFILRLIISVVEKHLRKLERVYTPLKYIWSIWKKKPNVSDC